MTIAAIYAHQGGWDEILLVAGPITVIVFVLIVAERRAIKQRAQSDGTEPAEPPESE